MTDKLLSSPPTQPFDDSEFYPTVEENVHKKMHVFFDYSRRLHGQIRAMAQREKDALADLHSDNNKDKPKHVLSRKKPVAIVGINFRAINETFSQDRSTGKGSMTAPSRAKSTGQISKLQGANQPVDSDLDYWMGVKEPKKIDKKKMNKLFTKKKVKEAELTDQGMREQNMELFEQMKEAFEYKVNEMKKKQEREAKSWTVAVGNRQALAEKRSGFTKLVS